VHADVLCERRVGPVEMREPIEAVLRVRGSDDLYVQRAGGLDEEVPSLGLTDQWMPFSISSTRRKPPFVMTR
jgi:hypothetical protein